MENQTEEPKKRRRAFKADDIARSSATEATMRIMEEGMAEVKQQQEQAQQASQPEEEQRQEPNKEMEVPTAERQEWEMEAHIGCSGKIPMSLYARTQSYRVQHKMSLTAQINVALDFWLASQGQ